MSAESAEVRLRLRAEEEALLDWALMQDRMHRVAELRACMAPFVFQAEGSVSDLRQWAIARRDYIEARFGLGVDWSYICCEGGRDIQDTSIILHKFAFTFVGRIARDIKILYCERLLEISDVCVHFLPVADGLRWLESMHWASTRYWGGVLSISEEMFQANPRDCELFVRILSDISNIPLCLRPVRTRAWTGRLVSTDEPLLEQRSFQNFIQDAELQQLSSYQRQFLERRDELYSFFNRTGDSNGIGELSCKFNARSSHLRCAVNPSGPCEGCSSYEATS